MAKSRGRRFDDTPARLTTVVLLISAASLLLGLLVFAAPAQRQARAFQTPQSPAAAAFQAECPEGSVLSDNGVTCELDVGGDVSVCPEGQQLDAAGLFCETPPEDPDAICPAGEQLDAAGLFCEPIPDPNANRVCPEFQKLDAAGLQCIPDEEALANAESAVCEPGYSLGRDGETCIADSPCDRNEVLNAEGKCQGTFQCPDGSVLSSDLLGCTTSGCADGELLSVDGWRCIAPDPECPDGSPRPVGGACLVVETIEAPDGTTEVIVRCAEADAFCQARIKQCADERAAGSEELGDECADPRGSCDPEEEECAASNERLVECATRDTEDEDTDDAEDAEPVAIGGPDDPCDDLCPELHRLDPSGECIEFLNPRHPCVSFGQIPDSVTTNAELDGYSYLAGLGLCVTKTEFLRRLGNFEAAAGAEADALTLLRETTSSYLSLEDQLNELDQMLVASEDDIRRFTEQAAEADAQRRNSEKLLVFTQKQLAREEALLQQEVLDVFVTGGNGSLVDEAILSSTNISEIIVAQTYGRAVLNDQVSNVSRIEVLEEEVLRLAATLEQAVAEVEESLSAAVETAEGLESLQGEAEQLRAEQIEKRDEEAELVAELSENKADFAQELGIFEQATREIADIIADTEYRVTAFAEFDGLLANPIFPDTVITSGYGPRLHPILGYVRNHNGVDITAGFGEDILASEAGIVSIASAFGGYGNTVVIDHGGGLLTLYAHMSAIIAEPGDEVALGDTIGLVGSTGLSTGPHLHFEVWEDGDRAVDPRPYLTDAE